MCVKIFFFKFLDRMSRIPYNLSKSIDKLGKKWNDLIYAPTHSRKLNKLNGKKLLIEN